MPFNVGENVGPYRILEKLGQGGMATVHKAYHAALDRYVALKALHPAFMEDPNFLKRFQREACVVAKLEHSNIVPIYDFSEHEGQPYLVMKFIEGITLKARINQGAIPAAEKVRILTDVGAALAYAHKQGILHRDVKPSNVLLANDDRIYLADFGLARIAEAGESTLSSDRMLGTPQYISPEQAMGISELDEGTDIYSLGVILYELAVGRVPFSADTPFSIIHDHIYTPLPLPRSVNPHVSEDLERVLLKALTKERADRYTNITAFIDAIQKTFAEASAPTIQIPIRDEALVPEIDAAPPIPAETVAAEDRDQILVETAVAEDVFSSTPQTVTAPPDDVPAVETVADAKLEPILDDASESDVAESSGITDSPVVEPRKRRFRWWYVPIILLVVIGMVFCGVLALGAILDVADNGQIDPVPTNAVVELPDIEALPAGSMDEAIRGIEENPDDPYAHLTLAGALWDAGNKAGAEEELWAALELAGEDMDVYLTAGQVLTQRELWVEAAHAMLEGALRTGTQFHGEAQELFTEAAYKAAREPDAEEGIPIYDITLVDVPLERVVKGRYALHVHADADQAQALVDEVLNKLKPDMPEALLLQAELLYHYGDVEYGNELIYQLLDDDNTSEWIKDHINRRLEQSETMLEEAIQKVDENWEDPWAHLELLKAYLALGRSDDASSEIDTIFEIAPEDSQFFHDLGDVIAAEGAWQYAAEIYELAIQLSGDKPEPVLLDKRDQAVYFGAVEPDGLEALLNTDPPLQPVLMDIAIARNTLHYVNVRDAREQIDALLVQYADLPMVRLLEAEMYIMSGDLETAQARLEDLLNQKTVPGWIIEEASQMLQSIKQ